MAAANKTIWGIHTMDDPLFLNQNLIAIGWEEMGDLSVISASRDAYKEKYIVTYPDAKKGSIPTSAGMLYRFVHEVREGDYIVFPSKFDRKINIGIVESAYFYDTIKAKWAGNVVLSAFPAFSVTNLLLVQCSSAVLQCSYGCIRAHPFPLIYAP